MKDFVAAEMASAKRKFAADEMSIEIYENEIEFWLSCDECDLCRSGQMCSGHYEQLVAGSSW